MKYLDTSDLIAVEHIGKVITAYTLADTDLSERTGKRLRDGARAVRLYVEVREYRQAVDLAEVLRNTVEDDVVRRVMERSIKTLRRHL